MFGSEKRALRAENARLNEELEEMRADAVYPVARDILAGAARLAAVYTQNPELAVAAAAETVRARVYAQAIGPLATRRADLLIAAERAEIEARAAHDAEEVAQAKLIEWRATEGRELEAHLLSTLTKQRTGELTREGRELLRGDVVARIRRLNAEGSTEIPELDYKDAAIQRSRAEEIRKTTRRTHRFGFELLEKNDLVTVAFVAPGNGHEALTESVDGWSRRPRTDLIEREIDVVMLDPAQGIGRIYEDQWPQGVFSDILQPETTVRMYSPESVSANMKSLAIYKAGPLVIQTLEGRNAGTEDLEVWYAELNGYRVLS